MIAGEIGEGGGSEVHAVDAMLLKPMARGLEREMGDTVLRQLGEDPMQLDRIGRSVIEGSCALGSHDADRAEARGAEALALPKLADEGGDRSLAVGAGDGDHGRGLAAEEARGDQRETAAGIGVLESRRRVVGMDAPLRH